MKNLVSQDYIDYQYEERKIRQHPYSGVPVDDLDRACHNHRWVLEYYENLETSTWLKNNVFTKNVHNDCENDIFDRNW